MNMIEPENRYHRTEVSSAAVYSRVKTSPKSAVKFQSCKRIFIVVGAKIDIYIQPLTGKP